MNTSMILTSQIKYEISVCHSWGVNEYEHMRVGRSESARNDLLVRWCVNSSHSKAYLRPVCHVRRGDDHTNKSQPG